MDDKATAAKIVAHCGLFLRTQPSMIDGFAFYSIGTCPRETQESALSDRLAMESAIVAALEAARREGAASVMRPPTVAQPPSPNTLLSDIDDDHDSNWCD